MADMYNSKGQKIKYAVLKFVWGEHYGTYFERYDFYEYFSEEEYQEWENEFDDEYYDLFAVYDIDFYEQNIELQY